MTIKNAYLKLIDEKEFTVDEAQLGVVNAYDQLKTRINSDAPYIDEAQLNFFQKMIKPFASNEHAHEYEDPRGLYIHGEVGRGKTFLMDLFFNNIDVPKKRDHFYHFMKEVHLKMNQLQGNEDPLKLVAKEFAKECKVLCVDEFHVIDITDAMILYRLLDALINEGIFFITTSNRKPSDLYEGGLQREQFLPCIALIEKRLGVIPLDSPKDYRLRHLKSADVWFKGDEATQNAHFVDFFADLSTVCRGEVTTDINGHAFKMKQMTHSITWFTFDEACVKPRSSQDFIVLAETYYTVLLSGLPILTKDLEDEARRFVIMVDEFYDQGVKLIIASTTDLQNLYKGTRLEFEFDRTMSRLIEMQSQDYLNLPARSKKKVNLNDVTCL